MGNKKGSRSRSKSTNQEIEPKGTTITSMSNNTKALYVKLDPSHESLDLPPPKRTGNCPGSPIKERRVLRGLGDSFNKSKGKRPPKVHAVMELNHEGPVDTPFLVRTAADMGFRMKDNKNPFDRGMDEALAIFEVEELFIETIKKHNVVVVSGQTGSGKTTQVPQFILDYKINNGDVIVVTQPRRVAAISLAKRVASERGEYVGKSVGYAVRFEECFSPMTKLKYVTDGLLLKEAQTDKLLTKYSVVILDEVHERTINTDLLLSMMYKADIARNSGDNKDLKPLKIVIMSATFDARIFHNMFPNCRGVVIPVKSSPVELVNITSKVDEYVTTILAGIYRLHQTEPLEDHMLVFLPGREEIHVLITILKSYNLRNMIVLPLYSALSHAAQLRAISSSRPGHRRVIVSTNIAETSLTIPGVRIVIDSGYAKHKVQVARGYDSLQIRRISKAESYQRSGRAGREDPGTCYRLFTNDEFERFERFPNSEVANSNLSRMLLTILDYGESRLDDWPWLEKPPKFQIVSALNELKGYNAIVSLATPTITLTDVGHHMAHAPVDPKFAAIILESIKENLFHEAATVISVLSSEPFVNYCSQREEVARQGFYSADGDLIMYYNVLDTFRRTKRKKDFCQIFKFNFRSLHFACKVRKQLFTFGKKRVGWKRHVDTRRVSHELEFSKNLRLLFARSLPLNVAVLDGNIYRTRDYDLGALEAKIHPASSMLGMRAQVVHFIEIVQLGGGVNYLCHLSPIESRWVPECELVLNIQA